MCLVGDLPKQVKLKKPSRLKTLDTKPGPRSSSPGTQRRALGPGRGGQWGWHSRRGCPHPQSRARGSLPSPGLYTAYTAHLHRDKALLRRLLKVPLGVGCSPWEGDPGLVLWLSPGDPQGLQKKRPSDVQTAVLRRHLLELTQSFIIPLVRPARGRGPGTGGGGWGWRLWPRLTALPPPGALHGQPHAAAEGHRALEGVVPGGGWGFSVRARGVPGKCPGETPKWPRRAPVRLVLQHWLTGHSPPLSQTPPQIRPFRQDDFLQSLERSGPQLTCVLKGDWLGLYRWAAHWWGPGLPRPVGARTHPSAHRSPQPPPPCPYRRFFKSPHFDGWYRQRHREMTQKLEALHLEAICEAVRGVLGEGAWRGSCCQSWGGLWRQTAHRPRRTSRSG